MGLFAVWRLLRRAKPCSDVSLLAATLEASRRVGLARAPRLLESNAVTTPMVLALGRPTLLIPAAHTTGVGEIDWNAAFAHELAHVVRGDGWSRLWVQFVTIALPLQPLVWVARRAFYGACEEACDDWAVASGSDPADLASTLLVWSNCRRSPGLLVGIGISSTSARIRRLLALHAKPSARLGEGWRWASIPVAILLIAGLAVAQAPTNGNRQSNAKVAFTQNGKATPEQSPPLAPDTDDKKLPETMIISGTCVDENKKPLADARVRLFFIDYYFDEKSQSQIGDVAVYGNGRFRIPDVDLRRVRDRHAALVLVAQSPGKATGISGWLDAEQARVQKFEFTLSPSATLQGHVTDAEGRPVADAIVSTSLLMEPVPGIGAAVTDVAGRYEMSDLRPFDLANQKPQPGHNGWLSTMIGPYRAHVHHPDYARQPFEYTKIPNVVDVILHRVALVEGQIVLGETGQPAVGAQLEFSNDLVSSDYWTRATTDDSGRFELATLPPGKYRMSAKLKGRPVLFRREVPLRVGKNLLDLRMEQGGIIRGRVIDARTGKPPDLAKGERMQISDSDFVNGTWFSGMNYADVEADGTFTLLVPAGRIHLGMYFGPNWRGVGTDALLLEGVSVSEGQTSGLDVRVEPQTPTPK